jgi:hypothetical protein
MKRFEALIYDDRDVQADHPESTLGADYQSVTAALTAVIQYLHQNPNTEHIYRVHIEPVLDRLDQDVYRGDVHEGAHLPDELGFDELPG